MATQFLSRVVLQQVTQRVLANVLEHLPGRLASVEEAATKVSGADLDRVNALAIDELREQMATTRDLMDQMSVSLAELERRSSWRRTAVNILTAVLAYLLGLGTVVVLMVVSG